MKINRGKILFVVASTIVIFQIIKWLISPELEGISAYDYHSRIIQSVSAGDKVYTAKNAYELEEGNYSSEQTLSDNGKSCLKNFKVKTATGASPSIYAIKIQTQARDLYYRVYMYSGDFSYIAPYRYEGGKLYGRMKLLRVECNYKTIAL